MTDQEAFDIMVEHLRNLESRSTNDTIVRPGDTSFHIFNEICVYNGSKCVVGILMTDEEQEKYGSFRDNVVELLSGMTKIGHTSHLHQLNLHMLKNMQDIHDDADNWGDNGFIAFKEVQMIAEQFGLVYKGPSDFV